VFCSGLQELELESDDDAQQRSLDMTALLPLRHLTKLHLQSVTDEQGSTLAQLTGLRAQHVWDRSLLSAVGLRHLASLEQLTSLRLCAWIRQ